MKPNRSFRTIAGVAAIALLLGACSTSKYDNFAKRKYMKRFHKEANRDRGNPPELYANAGNSLGNAIPATHYLATVKNTAQINMQLLPKPDMVELNPAQPLRSAGNATNDAFAEPKENTAAATSTAYPELARREQLAPASIQQPAGLDILEVIIAILLPPLAVALFTDSISLFLVNLLLWLLFYIPGLIHALIVLSRD